MNRILALTGALLLTATATAQVFDETTLEVAGELREQALGSELGYEITADLTTRIGNRLAGSENDARAVAWAVEMLEGLGFDRVWTEPVTFPYWVRETERVAIVAPVEQDLVATALGFSPATPAEGLEAEVVMFDDLAALDAAPDASVTGKIVFIRNRMERARDGSGYGPAVQARTGGSLVAARKGAAAIVIRSIGTSTNRFAHTGVMRFTAGSRYVPAAAISNPDADQLERLIALGEPVRMRVTIDASINQTYTSQNVIAQLDGATNPDSIVALGAHLDSWDVGTGALDDAAGVGIVTAAAQLIAGREQRPDRSIQVILFAAEEIGLWGGRAWAEAHGDEVARYLVASESDFGAGPIYEMTAKVADDAMPVIEAIQAELAPLGIAMGERGGGAGPDFSPMMAKGLAAVRLRQDGTNYFDYHHTENDTLDKVDPEAMKQNIAAFAVFAWLAANSPVEFGSGPGLVD
ncbi:M28 family peptidase [Wenzhouxiangella sp. XN79A]|uniref:M28 family peptidase n=1 Tax=Wenzhouxiangella sp. XN79A TaxID=2724193 RepID=UPI00144ABE40|nr:M28 family peptidase [Wenzhouxiangella sp. XN79A]NKI33637.1 M28 family peptidase [Wenzhouxiangella sp. XN79A]